MSNILAPFFVISLLLACCSTTDFFAPKGDTTTTETNNTYTNGTAVQFTGNASDYNLTEVEVAIWNQVNKNLIESSCNKIAKEYAGGNAWAVKGCTCGADESPLEKKYTCDIATIDPTHKYFANLDCSIVTKTCNIESNFGNKTLTFDELMKYGASYGAGQ